MVRNRRTSSHGVVLLSLLAGLVAGIIAQLALGSDHEGLKWAIANIAKPAGTIFLNLIYMIVVPLLFSALVLGVSQLGNAASLGKIGMKSLGWTIVFSSIAVAIGLAAVNLAKPGAGLADQDKQKILTLMTTDSKSAEKALDNASKAKTAAETITDMVPSNPLQSAVTALEGGLLPFMVFALIFGVALSRVPAETAAPLLNVLEAIFEVSVNVIHIAMSFAPIGIFGLIFAIAATASAAVFALLLKYMIVVLIALAIQLFVVYPIFLRLVAKRNPREFFKQCSEAMLTAFATSSSNATLPIALRVAEEEVGIPRRIGNFVLTIGATANQNGTALFEGISILFLCQLFGANLSFADQLTVMGLAIIAGIGTAGVPGGAWPMIAIILAKFGVPGGAIAICIGVDRLLDMSRTVLNVVGDITIAACVSSGVPSEEASDKAIGA